MDFCPRGLHFRIYCVMDFDFHASHAFQVRTFTRRGRSISPKIPPFSESIHFAILFFSFRRILSPLFFFSLVNFIIEFCIWINHLFFYFFFLYQSFLIDVKSWRGAFHWWPYPKRPKVKWSQISENIFRRGAGEDNQLCFTVNHAISRSSNFYAMITI